MPRVELTDASSLLYNFDNRDTRRGQVGTLANDHFGLLYNRLNLQAASGKLTLTLRADSAWFYASRPPEQIADELSRLEPGQASRDSDYRLRKLTEAGIELSNRFINWSYPAKYALTWGDPDFEITLGDSYAQLGRGLVLGLRKLDELASDNTVRGARVSARFKRRDLRLKLTALGGSVNPLRIDEASGRYLGVQGNVAKGFVAATEAGMPRAIDTAFTPLTADCQKSGTCSFAPDRLLAGQVEIGLSKLTLSTQASFVAREPALTQDTSRSASTIFTASQSLDAPNFLGGTSGYFEAAVQHLAGTSAPDTGYALYGSVSLVETKFTLQAEGKHYRRFFPLSANVSASRAREFALLAYSAPPTTEEIWNDTQFGSLNTCVSGGRLKGEAYATETYSVFAWLGHYRSFAESVSNLDCDTSRENENRIWDAAIGVNAHLRSQPARYQIFAGTRFDDTTRSVNGASGPTDVYYRELYLRYNVSQPLAGPFTLELQGLHRRRRESVGGPSDRWFEGQHSTAIDWGERLSAAIGVEYDSRPGTPLGYVNAMLSYRPNSAWSFALFAGQRRGALRCVGGVCRVYPAFEGVRLDATLRY